jgi:DNA-directed RNA polymerase specialized sigma24 family protein
MEVQDNSTDVLGNLTMNESYANIISQIKALPKILSDTLYLSIVLDHSNKEISSLLNISNDTVRQRLSRAKAMIKKNIGKEGAEGAK